MGAIGLLKSVRLRIYVLLWTAGFLTHFSWQSFDFSVVCLREEVLVQQALELNVNRSVARLNETLVEKAQESLKWLGPVFASWSAGTLVVNIPAGYLIDRFGVRFVLAGGVAIAAIMNSLIPVAMNLSLPLLCALRFLCGAATQGMRWSAQNSVAGKWAPLTEIGLLMGIGSSFSAVGNMLANTLGATLCTYTEIGWPLLFYSAAAMQALWVLSWWLFYCERPEWDKRVSHGELIYIGASRSFHAGLQSSPSLPTLKKGQEVPWVKILTSRPVWGAAVSSFANAWLTAFIATYGPTFFHSTATSSSLIVNGLLASMPFLGNLIVRLTSGFLSDFTMKHMSKTASLKMFNALAFGSAGLCMGIGTVVLREHGETNAVILIAAFTCLGANIAGSFKSPVLLGPRYAGVLTGSLEVLSSIGSIVSVNSIALLVSEGKTSQWRIIFGISSGMAISAMTTFLLFGSGETQPWANPKTEPIDPNLSNRRKRLVELKMKFGRTITLSECSSNGTAQEQAPLAESEDHQVQITTTKHKDRELKSPKKVVSFITD